MDVWTGPFATKGKSTRMPNTFMHATLIAAVVMA
jgi:hypothetical protein